LSRFSSESYQAKSVNDSVNISATKERISFIEVSRGFAALAVVLAHTSLVMGNPRYFGEAMFANVLQVGHAGVDFFFVLSGYIITYMHFSDIDKKNKFLPYIVKRFIRIFPIYWVSFALFLIALLLFSSNSNLSVTELAYSFFLVPQAGTLVNPVAWTLSHELLFYILFSFLILNKKVGGIIFIGWMICSIVNVFVSAGENLFIKFLFSAHNFEFVLGVCVSWLVFQKKYRSIWIITGIIGLSLVLLGFWLDPVGRRPLPFYLVVLYGGGFALMLYTLSCLHLQNKLPKFGDTFLLLGASSYSVYLIHFLVILTLAKLFTTYSVNAYIPLNAIYFMMAFSAIIVGVLMYEYIEKPTLRICRNWNQLK